MSPAKSLLCPIACYLAVTLLVPVLDGQRGARYAEHVAIVLGATSAVIAGLLLLKALGLVRGVGRPSGGKRGFRAVRPTVRYR